MKIAIFYVCTGRYNIFWDGFYTSAEKYFLPKHEKHYFVFTDGDIAHVKNPRVHRIEQQNLGWPNNTLYRYHMFLRAEKLFEDCDFCFFFNGNAVFCAPVGDDFLPDADGMLFVQHPGFFDKPRAAFTYETNPASCAYIASEVGSVYVCGGVNGAQTATYLAFMRAIAKAVDDDARNGVVAVWHDESHSNRYALDHPHVLRAPFYCYPEGWALPFAPKIRILDKARHGGHDYLRGLSAKPVDAPSPQVISVLMGGLGNQMFQYAAGRALAFRLNAELFLDTSWFAPQSRASMDTPREYSLSVFPMLSAHIAPGEQSRFAPKPTFGTRVCRRVERIWARLRGQFVASPPCITDAEVLDLAEFRKITAPCSIFGYWQKEEFFSDAEFLVRKEFAFPPLAYKAQALVEHITSVQNSTAVHVRRGDYVADTKTNAVHGLCSPEYYAAALRHIKGHAPDVRLFIFSDDPAWVRENFDTQGLPATVVDLHGEDEAHHDMHLMALCKHHVIANSSFSWWGAWLAQAGGITVAPMQWFADSAMASVNPCPERWLRL